ncbi:MAG: IS66 family transposase [Haliscomenobacter sp.]|nr:IS66 family transposase [Haliscomenobacter sp.]
MLLAYILVSKYADHLPLYRQLMMFKRSGIDINDVTLNGWVKQVIALLQILYERIRSSMLGSNYLMADESTIRVLDQDKKEPPTQLLRAYRDPVEGSVLFVYEKGRAGKYVRDHLSTFSGYLQTDAYTAYDSMPKANEGVTMVGCWAHVRRKFADALVVEQEQASYFVEQIQRLYAIERFCRTEGLSADAWLDARAQAKPILAGIKTRMLDLAPTPDAQKRAGTALRNHPPRHHSEQNQFIRSWTCGIFGRGNRHYGREIV